MLHNSQVVSLSAQIMHTIACHIFRVHLQGWLLGLVHLPEAAFLRFRKRHCMAHNVNITSIAVIQLNIPLSLSKLQGVILPAHMGDTLTCCTLFLNQTSLVISFQTVSPKVIQMKSFYTMVHCLL